MKPEIKIHKKFKLQGKVFNSIDELLSFSSTISEDVFKFLNEWFNDNDYVNVKTSGSTGQPKNIQLKKNQMVNSAKATGSFFSLFEDTKALLCMSVNYIAGKMMLIRGLVLGWDLTIVEPSSKPLNNLEDSFGFCAMVPLQVQNSLKELHKVKKLIIGGGAVSNELNNQLRDIKTECFAAYGMTETITHIAVKKLNCFKDVIANEMKQSHYHTIPNVAISQDARNCLVISAPDISNDVIITNDIVEIISDSEFEWLGRYDNIINSGGVKLIPEQIEAKLGKIINSRFFVYGQLDEKLGNKLILIVEGIINENLKHEVLKSDLLLKYEIPKEIHFVEEFFETETKKIDRIKIFHKFKVS